MSNEMPSEIETLKQTVARQAKLIESLEESVQIAFQQRNNLATAVDTLMDMALVLKNVVERLRDRMNDEFGEDQE